jgi:hypothetical protein
VTASICLVANSVANVMLVSWYLKTKKAVTILMNVMKTYAPTETAATPLAPIHVLVMMDSSLVAMFVKMLMNVFQVHVLVEIVSTHRVATDVTAMMAQLLEQEETHVTIKRRVLAGSESKMANAQEM